MSIERNDAQVIHNIKDIAKCCEKLVVLGGAFLLPENVVNCVLEHRKLVEATDDSFHVLMQMCEDPGC